MSYEPRRLDRAATETPASPSPENRSRAQSLDDVPAGTKRRVFVGHPDQHPLHRLARISVNAWTRDPTFYQAPTKPISAA